MHLFYTPDIQGNSYRLNENESRHAVRVLRLNKGGEVILVDGQGTWYEAEIMEAHPKACVLKIRSRKNNYKSLPYHLHLAVSPTKNTDRFEWFLEKATEIGITEITPLYSRRSERRQVKAERLERILISAMKQSQSAWKPKLNPGTGLEEFLAIQRSGQLGIAHCHPLERKGIESLGKRSSYTLLVGPEGDFTEDEVEKALQAAYQPIQLGESRLRTETAAVYLTAAVHFLHSGVL